MTKRRMVVSVACGAVALSAMCAVAAEVCEAHKPSRGGTYCTKCHEPLVKDYIRFACDNRVLARAYDIACVEPSFDRYLKKGGYGRHSGVVWPHAQGFWARAAFEKGEQNPAYSPAPRFGIAFDGSFGAHFGIGGRSRGRRWGWDGAEKFLKYPLARRGWI